MQKTTPELVTYSLYISSEVLFWKAIKHYHCSVIYQCSLHDAPTYYSLIIATAFYLRLCLIQLIAVPWKFNSDRFDELHSDTSLTMSLPCLGQVENSLTQKYFDLGYKLI